MLVVYSKVYSKACSGLHLVSNISGSAAGQRLHGNACFEVFLSGSDLKAAFEPLHKYREQHICVSLDNLKNPKRVLSSC